MFETKAKEVQNQSQFDDYNSQGGVTLGPYTSHIWKTDPRHLGFLLARYKFVAKMLEGKKWALEMGCGDAFGTPVVLQTVNKVTGVDWEPLLMEDNAIRLADYNCDFQCLDITKNVPEGEFDCAFSLDVIEHIPTEREHLYMENICKNLSQDAIFIVGCPNITANEYASEASKIGHINLKHHHELRALMKQHFDNVLLFSMNDEVVHTGYYPMAHYLFAVGIGKKAHG
ncbi:class I SAM-dependent methyltransferase [Pseudoalteromonas luteoviolacea]|uniref:Methyltransferase type 11 domain-containing protein n=1 Tax=Pseudoalteromonas luteoviolacea S4054 TaxID=1129367 RepID=A0A0F6A804_9GAMM|nr:methyltransferase domain-containing protein [Pseudoalteromonas luteoviolacea]AOT07468.1 hypothetical protein S4054249_06265 [Pseudoalteromonas luteoviolacea]AOT12384.1 hypothetical protein S40542_06265 [Pseudoalteromonas luteoviolacea]AOT17297.1 hypothetical protein S4054_06265 [Pseudoalteromonas luteoviolacea]KKE81981.1 hypothetical protein N479_20400 [Pseudoalteromonas luteoviolacea S4054]KZN74175.1 hypothetical protein N481_09345 [Pseudoalteromonas luteoviolacea S4047-1]